MQARPDMNEIDLVMKYTKRPSLVKELPSIVKRYLTKFQKGLLNITYL